MADYNYTIIDLYNEENACDNYTIGVEGNRSAEALKILMPPKYLAHKIIVEIKKSDGSIVRSVPLDYVFEGIIYPLPGSTLGSGEIVIAIIVVDTAKNYISRLFERSFIVTDTIDEENDDEELLAITELTERVETLEVAGENTAAEVSDLDSRLDLVEETLPVKANLVGGKVPASELPSYVDDIIEVDDYSALPVEGESGKLYVTKDNGNIYRWSGSIYIRLADTTEIESDILELQRTRANKTVELAATENTANYTRDEVLAFFAAGQAMTVNSYPVLTVISKNNLAYVYFADDSQNNEIWFNRASISSSKELSFSVPGNQLMTNFQSSKLAGIEAGAEVNPENVSAFQNDAGYITESKYIEIWDRDNLAKYTKSQIELMFAQKKPMSYQGHPVLLARSEENGSKINIYYLTSADGAPKWNPIVYRVSIDNQKNIVLDVPGKNFFSGSYNDLTDKPATELSNDELVTVCSDFVDFISIGNNQILGVDSNTALAF